jgi:hypothetical protein
MPVMELNDWIETYSKQGTIWIAKRLSGNDTLLNKANQAGPYLPTNFLFSIFPALREHKPIRDTWIDLYIDSHTDSCKARVVWYQSKQEGRITNLGGSKSALLDPESTGSIAVFVFELDDHGAATVCHVWVTDHATQEDLIEDFIGPVEPKLFPIWKPGLLPLFSFVQEAEPTSPCWLTPENMPKEWTMAFPSGQDIVKKAIELRPGNGLSVDERLVRRRDCEYQIFQSVEETVYLPKVQNGFKSIQEFVDAANSILNARKSRSGRSLEYQTANILAEEKFVPGQDFTHAPIIHVNKRPDFLFPSIAAYNDTSFPESKLRMLAAKTSCKERWAQVLEEADRIKSKHLLTLTEVSPNQFLKMKQANLQLVVPQKLQSKFHKDIQPHLMSLESFIAELRALQ